MSKKVLVTGSAGFVGAHLVEHIMRETDWEVVGIDSFNHRGDSLRIYHDPDRYKVFCHDLRSPISERLMKKIGEVDYVLSVASESHVDRSIEEPVPFCLNNVQLMLNVLEYARVAKPECFIQVSTDEVYGAALDDYSHKEWDTIIPSNPYSASKAAQEALAISYWRSYGVPVVITNTMNMIGERQDKEKFVPMVISRIMNNETVTIHGSENNVGSRHYLHARNFADALLFILKNTKPTMYHDTVDKIIVPDRYNIVGDIELDNLSLALMISDILGKELDYKLVDFHAARPGHDRRYSLNGEKLRKLGWRAPVSFEDSLRRTVEWTLQHPEWM
jgi:dTDP-glucose 4,6-dehydratase